MTNTTRKNGKLSISPQFAQQVRDRIRKGKHTMGATQHAIQREDKWLRVRKLMEQAHAKGQRRRA